MIELIKTISNNMTKDDAIKAFNVEIKHQKECIEKLKNNVNYDSFVREVLIARHESSIELLELEKILLYN